MGFLPTTTKEIRDLFASAIAEYLLSRYDDPITAVKDPTIMEEMILNDLDFRKFIKERYKMEFTAIINPNEREKSKIAIHRKR